MQAVVTFTGFETKKEGVSDHGPWALRIFKDAGGNKFQLFDRELGDALIQRLNQPITVTYEVEVNSYKDRNGNARTAQNNMIKSFLEGAQAGVGGVQEPSLPSHTGPQQTTTSAPQTSTGGGGQDYSPLRRKDALNAAIAAGAAGVIKYGDPMQLFAVADSYVKYYEGGSEALNGSGSSSQPDGATQY